jgi:membrane protein
MGHAFSQQVVTDVIHPMLHEVLHGGRADVISIGFVIAIWAGSSATATFVNTITIAYGMRDLRGAVHSRLLALWLFLGSMALGVILLPMLVLGPDVLKRTVPRSARHTLGVLIDDGYYPVVVILLLLGLTTLFHLAPPRRLPWRRGVPGAVLAMGVFLGGSTGLRAYINFIVKHSHAYGTIAAPIAALLFFYVLALGVLLGAEFNAAIENLSPTPVKPPRVLNPRGWQSVAGEETVETDPTEPREAAGDGTLAGPADDQPDMLS